MKDKSKDFKINEEIKAEIVCLVDDKGVIGEFSMQEALEIAKQRSLDLVEIAPMATPPVCKIMDYGKFKYQKSKKLRESKKKQKTIHLKEVKLRLNTDSHDYDFKIKNSKKFLEKGCKVKISIRFTGREIGNKQLGFDKFETITRDLENLGTKELPPRMEGSYMVAIFNPAIK